MSRYEQLAAFLAVDPDNTHLLFDAAEAAFAEQRLDEAQALLDHYRTIERPPSAVVHLEGMIAMHRERWDDAADLFGSLLMSGHEDTALRFNAAWSMAASHRADDAIALLDDATTAALPQAGALLISVLHGEGKIDAAARQSSRLLALHPDHPGLNAAVSTLALDRSDIDLARRCATRAGDHPEALTTLGTLALDEDDPAAAKRLFEQVLHRSPSLPRAWVGHGLARMLLDDQGAAEDLDRGAAQFGGHIGSWIAAGWAHFVAGRPDIARARFETALAIDATFAESHGSLAVVDLLDGDAPGARRRMAIALRLDRDSFTSALAAMLIASEGGNPSAAQEIFRKALSIPIDDRGRTLAHALSRLGAASAS